jgi:hypothetical protein
MCYGCFDADKRQDILKKNPECSGVIKTPFMTIEELKSNLFHEWIVSDKKKFFIYKDAVIDAPQQFSWDARHFSSGKEERISIEFI